MSQSLALLFLHTGYTAAAAEQYFETVALATREYDRMQLIPRLRSNSIRIYLRPQLTYPLFDLRPLTGITEEIMWAMHPDQMVRRYGMNGHAENFLERLERGMRYIQENYYTGKKGFYREPGALDAEHPFAPPSQHVIDTYACHPQVSSEPA